MEFLRQLDCLGLAGIHDRAYCRAWARFFTVSTRNHGGSGDWLRSNSSRTASGIATSLKSLVRMSAVPTLRSPVRGEASETTINGQHAIHLYAGLPTVTRRASDWEFCAFPIRAITRVDT